MNFDDRNNRVVFYSKGDGSVYHNLKHAEYILKNINLNTEFSINDYLEFYHIKLHFDNKIFLPSWKESEKINHIKISDELWSSVKDFWIKINENNFTEHLNKVDFRYAEAFWELIDYFHVYKRISRDKFDYLLKYSPRQINYILKFKNIVRKFDGLLRNFLMNYKNSSELLLRQYSEKRTDKSQNFLFPNKLSLIDKEIIISDYLEQNDCNLNYVRLVVNLKNSNSLRITSKTRLKAKRKASLLNEEILQEGHTWNIRIQVSLSVEQQKPVKYTNENNVFTAAYSINHLDDQKNNLELFHVFPDLFQYVNKTKLISLVAKERELDSFEKVSMKSKHEYFTGTVFVKKNFLSNIQLVIFEDYLINQRGSSLQRVIEEFINGYLNKYFIRDFKFKFPTPVSTYLEKIRILAPEFEYLLKQYRIFVEEGFIDFELLELESMSLNFSGIKSLVKIKYCYSNNDKIQILKFQFFSVQSMLYYIEPYNEKYSNLYDLLIQEDVQLEEFRNYQKGLINNLIEEGYLYIDSKNFVKINKPIFIYIIGELSNQNVLNYWRYPDCVRKSIDEMLEDNLLISDNTLFTKDEQNYFNFYLNKKNFTNGLDLRNKYLHGTNPSSEENQKQDYYNLIRLIVLALIKIEDDVILKRCIGSN
jgi:hypothetical protein